jgi:hypothetical protein
MPINIRFRITHTREQFPFHPCDNQNMRSIVSSLAFFCALGLHAESPRVAPPDSDRQERTLHNIKQFASAQVDRLSCTQIASPGSAKTITVEFSGARRGTPSSIETGSLLQEVFAPSSQTEFHWDHWGTINGKAMAVYNYSFQVNGKTRAGSIFADENSGAIARITFRGADAPAHLFCSAQSR